MPIPVLARSIRAGAILPSPISVSIASLPVTKISAGSPTAKCLSSAPGGEYSALMVKPLERSNGGRISSVADFTAVEMKALISAACAVARRHERRYKGRSQRSICSGSHSFDRF
jgi:hypothetical protein